MFTPSIKPKDVKPNYARAIISYIFDDEHNDDFLKKYDISNFAEMNTIMSKYGFNFDFVDHVHHNIPKKHFETVVEDFFKISVTKKKILKKIINYSKEENGLDSNE